MQATGQCLQLTTSLIKKQLHISMRTDTLQLSESLIKSMSLKYN